MTTEKLLDAIGDISAEAVYDAKAWPQTVKNEVRSKRHLVRIFVAAAIMIALAGTAYAIFSASDWFKDFFAGKTDGELSAGQLEFIEGGSAELDQSATSDSHTVTLDSAITDGSTAFITLHLVGPEGSVLDADCYSFFAKLPASASSVGSQSWTLLDDGDPTDNAAAILWEIRGDHKFTEGTQTITLTDLRCRYDLDGITQSSTILSEGTWTFEVEFAGDGNSDREVELITAPVTVTGERLSGATAHAELTSFRLRSLGANITYLYPNGVTPEALDFSADIVMKDGTTVHLIPGSGSVSNYWDPENALGQFSFRLKTPIVLEETDHILFSDGTKIPMP